MTAQEILLRFESTAGDMRHWTAAQRVEFHRLGTAAVAEQEAARVVLHGRAGVVEGVSAAALRRRAEAEQQHSGKLPLDAECEQISSQGINKNNNNS